MAKILHMRGDIGGMFLFFTLFFIGLMQIVIAWKRLNGLSVTGYPDRRVASILIGTVIAVGSCLWYFSRPGHFAHPDVEGIETLVLLGLGLSAALVLQVAVSALVPRHRVPTGDLEEDKSPGAAHISVAVDGSDTPALFWPATGDVPAGKPVLLLHDYGGDAQSVAPLAGSLYARGHAVMAIDLDGHGGNPRGIDDPLMGDLLEAARDALEEKAGRGAVSAVGAGLGGTLAIELAGRTPLVERAIALDPPAVEPTGYPAVNSLRELGPVEMIRALLKPTARSATGKRVSLSRLLRSMPGPRPRAGIRIAVLGTEGTWFNSPADLVDYTKILGLEEPRKLEGNHGSIALEERTPDEIDRALRCFNGPTARQA